MIIFGAKLYCLLLVSQHLHPLKRNSPKALIMALFLAQYAHARALRRERVFRDRLNPMDDYSDKRMHKYYRFTQNGVMPASNRYAGAPP